MIVAKVRKNFEMKLELAERVEKHLNETKKNFTDFVHEALENDLYEIKEIKENERVRELNKKGDKFC